MAFRASEFQCFRVRHLRSGLSPMLADLRQGLVILLPRMTKRRFAAFATGAVLGTVTLMVGVLLAADLYAHHRVERSVGVNRQGYRGPVAGRKQPGETRVVMLGGSTVFGYDVEWDDTIPAALERQLRARDPKARVINLGFIGEGALAFVPTLESYSYLDYDIVCLLRGLQRCAGRLRAQQVLAAAQLAGLSPHRVFPDPAARLARESDDAAARQRGRRL